MAASGQAEINRSARSHRRDIDGLRAIAVLGVLAYHFDLGVGGGFGGVDVFFVISGFLIAGILIDEIEAGTFSVGRFYERRIRRILPALVACLVTTALAATWLLFPIDYLAFGKSLLAAITSTSNYYFAHQQGYFDVAAVRMPLLHTWSLSIEEQFYAVFPVLLYWLCRSNRAAAKYVILAIALVSLAVSIHLVKAHPPRAFFSTPGRVWELLVGALLALKIVPQANGRLFREVQAAAGAALILGCYFGFSNDTAFPGLAAVPLCLGAALIIHAGSLEAAPQTAVARVLSSAPFVGVGLISYSVYLWHWPLFVLTRYRFPELWEPDFSDRIALSLGLAALSIVVGALSWRYVEQPFRRATTQTQTQSRSRMRIFVGAAVTVATIAAAAVFLTYSGNSIQRWPDDIVELMRKERGRYPVHCTPQAASAGLAGDACVVGSSGPVDTILWGDSHAAALSAVFAAYADAHAQRTIVATQGACPPLLDVTLYGRSRNVTCRGINDKVLSRAKQPDIRRIVMTARWALYSEGVPTDQVDGGIVRVTPKGNDNGAAFEALLETTVKRVSELGREIIIIGPVPEHVFDVRVAIAGHRVWGTPLPTDTSMDRFRQLERRVMPILERLARLPNVKVLYPHEYLCSHETCAYSRNGEPLYSDSNHLNVAGTRMLSDLVAQAFADKTPNNPKSGALPQP